MSEEKKVSKTLRTHVLARISEVQELILLGHTRSSILQLTTKYRVSDRMIDDYISKAKANISEVNSLTLQDNLATIVSNQWLLYRAAIASKNLHLARQILMDVAKVRGLDQQTINHVVNDQRELADLSNAELETILGATVESRH